MNEVVVALLMFLNGNMIEHTYKEKMSDCLKSKRMAERVVRPERVVFACKNLLYFYYLYKFLHQQNMNYL